MEILGPGPVAVDSAIFIYFIEEDPRFLPLVDPLFRAIDEGSIQAVTSALTLLEVLVVPYRAGNHELAERYETLLTHSKGLRLLPLDPPILRAAAHLRAITNVKTPDALQLAAALGAHCTAFVTNDRDLPRLADLRIVQLAALV